MKSGTISPQVNTVMITLAAFTTHSLGENCIGFAAEQWFGPKKYCSISLLLHFCAFIFCAKARKHFNISGAHTFLYSRTLKTLNQSRVRAELRVFEKYNGGAVIFVQYLHILLK